MTHTSSHSDHIQNYRCWHDIITPYCNALYEPNVALRNYLFIDSFSSDTVHCQTVAHRSGEDKEAMILKVKEGKNKTKINTSAHQVFVSKSWFKHKRYTFAV